MSPKKIEDMYHARGLTTRLVTDEPGKVYPLHQHAEVYLCVLEGSAKIKLGDADWQTLTAGEELRIVADLKHEAVVGPDGWKYIIAGSAEVIEQLGR
jgi:quercetin dioxygenase-like cupin family protein